MRKSLMKGIIIFGAVLTAVMMSAVLLQAQEKVPIIIPLSSGDKVVGDAVAGDVRDGKTFSSAAAGSNITGTLDVSSGSCSDAPVRKTGQVSCWDGSAWQTPCSSPNPAGQDGDLQKGVTWPNPRFTDNSNGTVTDKLTGLVWTKKADCTFTAWSAALTYANAVHAGYSDTGVDDCGIDDGSTTGGIWRLPNIEELLSLVDYEYSGPALGTTPFTGSFNDCHWTSTTYSQDTDEAWGVAMTTGSSAAYVKSSTPCNVWLVSGPN